MSRFVGSSVGPSVGPSVCPSVRPSLLARSTRLMAIGLISFDCLSCIEQKKFDNKELHELGLAYISYREPIELLMPVS